MNYFSYLNSGPSRPFPVPRGFSTYMDFTKGLFWDGEGLTGAHTLVNKFLDIHPQTILIPDEDGNWESKATDVPCINGLGLHVVPTSINQLRNNSMEGATVGGGLPNNWVYAGGTYGLTREIIGIGSSNGLPYMDVKYSGVTDATGTFGIQFEQNASPIAAAVGQVWTGSIFVAIIDGSTAGLTSITFRPARGYSNTATTTIDASHLSIMGDLNGQMKRFSHTVTLQGSDTTRIAPQILLNFNIGAVINITIRIWAPQVEIGSFATPPILTTSAAVTRTGNAVKHTFENTNIQTGVGGIFVADLKGFDASKLPVLLGFNPSTQVAQTLAEEVMEASAMVTGVKKYVFAASPDYTKVRVFGEADTVAVPSRWRTDVANISFGGNGYNADNNLHAVFKRLGLKFDTFNDTKFDALYSMATYF